MNGLRDASAVFHVLCILAVNVEYGNDDVSSNTVLGQVNFQEYTVSIFLRRYWSHTHEKPN